MGVKEITGLWVAMKNDKATPEKVAERVRDVLTFLSHLEHEVPASPMLKTLRVKWALEFIEEKLHNNNFPFPEEITTKALALKERFEAENWGEGLGPEDLEDEEQSLSASSTPAAPATAPATPTTPTSPTGSGTAVVRLPSPNHPIWGVNGIMHGLARKPGAKSVTYIINPDYKDQVRNASVFGHNGLTVGAWFPLLRAAYFHGAHGQWVRGIHGDPKVGAYSIVVGGSKYEDMDDDRGDVIWYSADNSVENTDRDRHANFTGMTRSLIKSIDTRHPVRVLRKGNEKNSFAPDIGFRYDGLYRVVHWQENNNSKGGKYVRFKLKRLGEQPLLSYINHSSPTRQQVIDYHRFREGY